jgi:hypothetical protein
MKPRASRWRMVWKAREKPRTPVREPTPAATARMTKRKRPEEARDVLYWETSAAEITC